MKILFSGCSLCYGQELENRSDRYSDVIGRELNVEVVNIAGQGYSNDKIVRKTITYFEEGNTADLVIPCFALKNKMEGFVNGILVRHQIYRKYSQNFFKYAYNDENGQYNYDKNQYLLEIFLRGKGLPYRLLATEKRQPTKASNYGYDQFKKTEPYLLTYPEDLKLPRGHPNAEAHRMLAMEIIDELNHNQLLDNLPG